MGHLVVMDDSEAQFALTAYSRRLWTERAAALPPELEDDRCGTLWVAADDEELAHVRKKAAFYAARGVAVEVLDAEALARPSRSCGRGSRARCASGRPRRLPAGRGALAPRAGARAAAPTVETRRGASRRSSPGRVRCARPLARGRPRRERRRGPRRRRSTPGLPIAPRKGHLVITDRYPGFCRHQLVELGYLKSAHTLTRESVAFNLQPRATGQLLLGSSRELVGWDASLNRALRGAHAPPRAGVHARASRGSTRSAPGPASARRRPTSCRSSGMWEPGLWVAAGHEGLGITTALGTARLLADLVLGRAPAIDPAPFDPRRAMPRPCLSASRFTIDGRPRRRPRPDASLLAALWNAGARAVRTSVTRRAARPALRHGHLLRVPGHDRRRAAPARRAWSRCATGCASRCRPRASAARSTADRARQERPERLGVRRRRRRRRARRGSRRPSTRRRPARARCCSTSIRGRADRSGATAARPPAAARAWLERLARSGATRRSRARRSSTRADRASCSLEHDGPAAARARSSASFSRPARASCFLPFPGWTLPGVIGAGGAQALLKAGARFAGAARRRRGLGAAAAPGGGRAREDRGANRGRRRAGAARRGSRASPRRSGARPRKLAEGLGYARALRRRALPHGHLGREVDAATRRARARALTDGRRALALGLRRARLRLRPRAEPGAGAPPRLRDARRTRVVVDARQQTSVPGVFARGRAVRRRGRRRRARRGAIAGLAAAGASRRRGARHGGARAERAFAARLARAFALRDELRRLARPDTIVCRCEDVAARPPRRLREPRARPSSPPARGMGPCQGRVCGPALAFLFGWDSDTVRPPARAWRASGSARRRQEGKRWSAA